MAGINTRRPHMFKAKHKDKHFDLMQLLWNSYVWKKFQEGEKQHCVAFVKTDVLGKLETRHPLKMWGHWIHPWLCPSASAGGGMWMRVSAGSAQQENIISLSLFLQKRITQTHLNDTSCSAARFRVHLAVSCSCGSTVRSANSSLICVRT